MLALGSWMLSGLFFAGRITSRGSGQVRVTRPDVSYLIMSLPETTRPDPTRDIPGIGHLLTRPDSTRVICLKLSDPTRGPGDDPRKALDILPLTFDH